MSHHHFSLLQMGRLALGSVEAAASAPKYFSFAVRSAARLASICSWVHIPAHRTLPLRIQ